MDERVSTETTDQRDAAETAISVATPPFAALNFNSSSSVDMPRILGPYRLDKELGVGGMGQVWLAEQTEPVHRWVALKLVRAGLYDEAVVQRFLAERQSLALMSHPAIAKVFDAGTTPAGQPYFAMEYVEGPPITTYCDRKKLDIAGRLTLFREVCEGVQHAHQKAIIHRDLKPSNILVIEIDGKPHPRIIDFGVAKTAVSLADGETMLTQAGEFLGTPGYMSPEQVDPQAHDIDTRADVYSLGVVLYELLTGVLPFDATRWKKKRLDELRRELREGDAPRPSANVSSNRNTLSMREAERGADPGQLAILLRGDLDWITMKALEKDRERRYESPRELAADIERYLRNRPIEARPASAAYRISKYIRRHRVSVTAIVGSVLLLFAFAIAQAIQLRRITRERDRADRITGFMTDMFKVVDPGQSRGNTITAREILDTSSMQIESGMGKDPTVRADLMQVMALTYSNLGLYDRARELSRRAFEIRKSALGPNDRKTLESMTQMGWILFQEGRDTEAEPFLQRTIAVQTQVLGPDDPLTLETENNRAMLLERQAHYAEAEKLEREVLAVGARKLGPEHPQVLRSMKTLAGALQGESRFQEAEREYRQLLDIERRTLGEDHPAVLATMHNLANMLQEQGRYPQAEAIYRETLKIETRVLGPEHPDTANTMTTLGNTVRYTESRKAEAEALYRKSLAIELRVAGPEHAYTTRAKEGLANVLSAEHRYAEAEELLRQVLDARRHLLGPDHTDTLLSQYNLASVMLHQGRFAESERLMRDTLQAQTRVLDANDPDTLASKDLLARVLLEDKRPDEAAEWARQAFDAQLRLLGPQHPDTIESLRHLATALAETGRYEESKQLYAGTIAKMSGVSQPEDSSETWYEFATVAANAGHREDAFASLHEAIDGGYSDAEHIRTDEDLKVLRGDPRFGQIIAQARTRAATPSRKAD